MEKLGWAIQEDVELFIFMFMNFLLIYIYYW